MTWVELPTDFDPHSLAEFIEAELLFADDDYLSLTEIRSLFPVGSQPTEDDLSFAFSEIERRTSEFGQHYPYLVDDRGVLFFRDASSTLYSFLLLMSLKGTPTRETRDFPRSDPLFDAIAREAFRAERGPQAQALVFAWPPRGDRPGTFPRAVEWAAGLMGVGTRNAASIPPHLQDAGVDVIVWRPFPDGRNGFQIMLVQNTVQWSFRKKPYEVRARRWLVWLEIGVEPSVGFAVPFAMPRGDIWWEDVADGTTLVMDRGRLLHAVSDEDPTRWEEWPALMAFVDAELEVVRTTGEVGSESSVSVPRPRKKTIPDRQVGA